MASVGFLLFLAASATQARQLRTEQPNDCGPEHFYNGFFGCCAPLCGPEEDYLGVAGPCGACVPRCAAGELYNPDMSRCEPADCPEDSVYDSDTNACVSRDSQCGPDQFYNGFFGCCAPLCGPKEDYLGVAGPCGACVPRCAAGELYNPDMSRCEPADCPAGQAYNSSENRCE